MTTAPAPHRPFDRSAPTQTLENINDCIPETGVIRDYIEWAYRTTHAPPLFHLAAILPVVAYEASRRGFVLEVEESNDMLLRVWTCIAGSSGAGKGTAIFRAKDFFDEYQKKRHETVENPSFLALEGSIPGLLAALADKYFDEATERTHAILYHEELSRVISQEAASEALIMLYDGRDYTRQLRSIQKEQKEGAKTNDTIRKPCLSAVFTTPSASLEQASTVQHVAGGLYSRMLWMVGDVTRDQLMFRERREADLRAKAIRSWLDWARGLDAARFKKQKPRVFLANETEDILAEGLFEQLRSRIADDTRLQGVYLRMLTHARVLSGIFAVSRGASEVDLDDMCRAVNLAQVCLGHVETLDEQLAVSADYRLQSRILEQITRSGLAGSTKRDMYWTHKLSRVELQNALEALLERGEVVFEKVRSGGPGRPMEKYYATAFAPKHEGRSDD